MSINLPGGYLPPSPPDCSDGGSIVRASSIGKPALSLAARLFGLVSEKQQYDERTQLIFYLGDCFEQWLHNFLLRSGYTIHATQQTHSLYGVVGHSDFIVSDPRGYKFVVDAKALNDRTWKSYKRYGLKDDRGYVSQLTVYCNDVNLPGCVIALNKNTAEIETFWVTTQQRIEAAERIRYIAEAFQSVTSFEECFKYFQAPPPKPEVHQKEYTGRFLVPFQMMFDEARFLLYNIVKERNPRKELKEYVQSYRVPEGYEQYRPSLYEDFG